MNDLKTETKEQTIDQLQQFLNHLYKAASCIPAEVSTTDRKWFAGIRTRAQIKLVRLTSN